MAICIRHLNCRLSWFWFKFNLRSVTNKDKPGRGPGMILGFCFGASTGI